MGYLPGGEGCGGGVYAEDSVVRACWVVSNSAAGGSDSNQPSCARGAGVHLVHGRIENCVMTGNGLNLQLPNALVFKSVITNYTCNPRRRFDFTVTIDGKSIGNFNTCSGLKVEVVMEQREEGGAGT